MVTETRRQKKAELNGKCELDRRDNSSRVQSIAGFKAKPFPKKEEKKGKRKSKSLEFIFARQHNLIVGPGSWWGSRQAPSCPTSVS